MSRRRRRSGGGVRGRGGAADVRRGLLLACDGAGGARPRDRHRLQPPRPRRAGLHLARAGGRRRRDHDRGGLRRGGQARRDQDLHVQLALDQPARRARLRGDMDELRQMTVTPDRYVTYRYAGASGDFNPIHLDDEFARSVDLPSKILHGLWTMAQVARAQSETFGSPLALKSLSVQFRGMGVPEEEITVTSKLKSQADGEAVFTCEAVQDKNKLVRRGRAVLRISG